MSALQLSGLRLVGPALLIVILILIVSHWVNLQGSFYKDRLDDELNKDRFLSIDGLRGILAISVILHHAVITYYWYVTGRWELPSSKLASQFGQGAVAMFFMVTAFLFWHRGLIHGGNINSQKFLMSRITRLSPMFFLTAALVVLTALCLTKFRIVDAFQTCKDALAWMSFGLLGSPNINGFENTVLINTVFWTLAYEWRFYLLFPVLLLFISGRLSSLLFIFTAVLIGFYSSTNVEWYFLYGALTAKFLAIAPTTIFHFLRGRSASILALLCLCVIPLITPIAYSPQIAPVFFVPFLIIAAGNSLFGILTLRASRLLGMVSYSIYLLHNFALFLIFRLVDRLHPIAMLDYWEYWSLVAVSALITVGSSMLSYRFVELPFMRSSKGSLHMPHGDPGQVKSLDSSRAL